MDILSRIANPCIIASDVRNLITLLHVETKPESISKPAQANPTTFPSNHASVTVKSDLLLMTCKVLVEAPQGSIKVRVLLDSSSSASFISERVAQALHLQRYSQNVIICGIAGLSRGNRTQSLTNFRISSLHSPAEWFNVTAIIVPHVTCDLPVRQVPSSRKWKHLANLRLADPDFGKPGRIDLLLGVDIFVDVVRQGRRKGSCDSPTAFETAFG